MDFTEKTAIYLKEAYAELKNVNWPSKKEIKQHTLLVIGISVATAIFLGVVDYVFQLGLAQIIGLVR